MAFGHLLTQRATTLRGFLTVGRSPHTSCKSICQRWLATAVKDRYDYIIVGAGSAGCVLANRLSADKDNKVLVLEAGRDDHSWKVEMPAALMYTLFNPKFNYCYWTEPQKHMDNRKMYWPRAKMLGGCSSCNAMVYIRGHAYDYDRWESEGATGWSYADCLPYFKRSQTHEYGEDDYRGGSGPQHVSRGYFAKTNPLFAAFVQAGVQAGYPFTDDMNGYQQEGFGYMDMTIHKGVRANTSREYLHPASLSRSNLTVGTVSMVNRILFDGKRAVGIEYSHRGTTQKVYVDREVIVSAGAINSPQLLMLSGLGDADHLAEFGIPVVEHLPGVGSNLQDHLEVYVQHRCSKPITLYRYQWRFPLTMIKTGLEWFAFHKGSASTAHLEAGGFIRSEPGVTHPDIQFHFLPSVVVNHGSGLGDCHAFQVHVGPMRATSVGKLTLQSNKPEEHVRIDPNYNATERDRTEFRASVRLTRELFEQKAFDPFREEELLPGVAVQSDADIDTFIRAHADSAYHPSCTCKMGKSSDNYAVLDHECRVRGTEALRVVDASAMPSIVSGNLNGPVIMMAEKAADIILGNAPLPKSTAPVYQPKTLDTQR